MTKPISDLALEQYLLQELPLQRMQEIQAQLALDPVLQQRLHALQQSNRDILHTYPVGPMAQRIQEQATQGTRSKHSHIMTWFLPGFSLAAVAGLVFLVMPLLQEPLTPGDTTRMKGAQASLYIYRKTETKVELMQNGSRARKGDLLQLTYVSAQDPYGVIFSIDGRGKLTLHYPTTDTDSTRLMLNKKIPLISAYELDDAPDFERFFLVTSQQPLHIPGILQAARRLAENTGQAQFKALRLDPSLHQISIRVQKGE